MDSSRVRVVFAWVLAVLLAAFFGLAGVGKLTGSATEMFAGWGYPAWFALAIGVVETLGAIALLVPRTTRFAVYLLTAVMLGAIYTHIANGEAGELARPLIPLALLWVLWRLRRPS